ncbi:MAG: hypothetical protein WCK78_18700 [Paludibacter sp.]
MNKIIFKSIFISFFILNPLILFSQKDSVFIKRIPHQISVEFGYRNSFYQNTYLLTDGNYASFDANGKVLPNQVYNSVTHGVGILADYAWQFGGLTGKKPAIYLSIPMGYTILLPDNSASKRISMLNYGWTIRHNLTTSDKKLIPFVGYGLFLNNMSMEGVSGSVSGHQTQFEGGLNFSTATKLQYFVKLQASYSSYPKLGYAKSLHFMYADLRVGVRF